MLQTMFNMIFYSKTNTTTLNYCDNISIYVSAHTHSDLRRQDSNTSSEDQKHSSYKLSTPSASSPGRPPLPPKRNLSTVLSLQPDSTPTGRALPKDDRKSKDRISMPTFRQCDNDVSVEMCLHLSMAFIYCRSGR